MKNFHLRPLKTDDAPRMLSWMRNPDITQYLQIGGKDTSQETVLAFIERSRDESENLHRAIVDEFDEYLGTVSLKHIDREKQEAEYAISMHPSALGTGASAEGSRQILAIAFDNLKLKRVYLNVLEENRRAVRFYQKFGFRYTHQNTLSFRGKDAVLLWFEIQRPDQVRKDCNLSNG